MSERGEWEKLKKLKSILFILVLGLLLASCGGSDKNSSDKSSTSAPTATGPDEAVFGDSYDLSMFVMKQEKW